MPEESQANNLRRLSHFGGGSSVRLARLRVTGGMVVRNREGPPVVSQHRVQDLPDRHERAIHRTLRHGLRPQYAVGCVAHDHEHPLSAQASQLAVRQGAHVGKTPQYDLRVRTTDTAPQLERRDDSRRLGDPDATGRCQLLWPRNSQVPKASVVREQLRREIERAEASRTVADDEREELALAQRIHAAGE